MKKMKRWMGALCVLMLVPTLALADGEKISVAELREQAEALGRWTQTYQAHGRTIEVDMPVIVPEVERVPVVQVSALMGSELVERAGLPVAEDQTNAGVGIFYEDTGVLSYLDSANTSGEAVTVYRCIPEEIDSATFTVFHREPLAQSSGNWGFTDDYYYPYEVNPETVFAEDNELSLADAQDALKRLLTYYCGEETADVEMDYVEVLGRARKRTGRRWDDLGEYKKDYPKGTYCLHYRQRIEGIPVYMDIGYKMLTTGEGNITQDVALKCSRIGHMSQVNKLEFMDYTSFFLNAELLRKERIVVEDVPLAPLGEVMDRLEEEIEAGRIRDVFALRLGYVCYLDEGSPETYTLYPTWMCDCIYTKSARESIMENVVTDAFRENFRYEQILLDAQTCELQAGWIAEDEGLYHVEPVTWEDGR